MSNIPNQRSSHFRPEIPLLLKLINGKWKLSILWALSQLGLGVGLRFNELKRSLGTISTSVLTAQLKELKQNELITQKKYVRPKEVVYILSPLGKTLTPLLKAISDSDAALKGEKDIK